LLVIPSAVVAWYIALVLGLLTRGLVENFCPPTEMVSGVCVAAWWQPVESTIFVLFSGISAVFVVLCAAVTAPRRKREVVLIAYLTGAVVASWWLIQAWDIWKEFVAAILFGGVTCYYLMHRYSTVPGGESKS
jgi:hypothetical protein